MVVHRNYEHIKMSNKSYKIASTGRTLKEEVSGRVCVANVCVIIIRREELANKKLRSDINGLLPIQNPYLLLRNGNA